MQQNLLNKIIFAIIFVSFIIPSSPAFAENVSNRQPVDLMLILDNSCSMFSKAQVRFPCDLTGSDPDLNRISAANLFLARLGLNEPNEDDFRVGVVTLGAEPVLTKELSSITTNRDEIPKMIAGPKPVEEASLLPGLKMAYQELDKADQAVDAHIPAIVMTTDGTTSGDDGEIRTNIENLISGHPDYPLFWVYIQNVSVNKKISSEEISYWQGLQAKYSQVFFFTVTDPRELSSINDQIINQLTGTTQVSKTDLRASGQQNFTVGPFVDKVIVTIIRKSKGAASAIIKDPLGKVVSTNEEGVMYFKGKDNLVEVVTITSTRITDELRTGNWIVSTSTQSTVLIDWEGNFRINPIYPNTESSLLLNRYKTTERQSPTQDISIRFSLLDNTNNVILASQQLSGEIVGPNGIPIKLNLANVKPDNDGIYDVRYDLLSAFPDFASNPGRITIKINAGAFDSKVGNSQAVASMIIYMDIGLTPFIRSISPQPVVCEEGQPAEIRVNLEDYELALEDSLQVKVYFGDEPIVLERSEAGVYKGELTDVCKSQVSQLSCSDKSTQTLKVQLDAKLKDGTVLSPVYQDVELQYLAKACTATPLPTATVTPAPTATPAPDSDNDGVNDLVDECPNFHAILGAKNGCFPWGGVFFGVASLIILFVSIFWLGPYIKVRSVSKPPEGYLQIVTNNTRSDEIINLNELGIRKRVSKIIVGSHAKLAQVVIPRILPIEFFIERRAVITVVRVPGEKEPFIFLDETLQQIRTSDPNTIILVSTDKNHFLGLKGTGTTPEITEEA